MEQEHGLFSERSKRRRASMLLLSLPAAVEVQLDVYNGFRL
jgi:hypothetical protein